MSNAQPEEPAAAAPAATQPGQPAAPAAPAGPAGGETTVAEKFALFAQATLANPNHPITEVHFKEAAALLEGASRLNPQEPRYLRLLIEADLQAHNPDAATEALRSYLALDESDQSAWAKLIDLYASKMESGEERLAYYEQVVDTPRVPEPVRSYGAVRAAKLLLDRARDADAQKMLEQSLRLNSLNPEALKLNLDRLSADPNATPTERVRALFQLLRANPAQPAVMTRLASELADVGLYRDARSWYNNALSISQRLGQPLDRVAVLEDGFLSYMVDDLKGAEQPAGFLLQSEPFNPIARLLNLLVARRRGADAKDLIEKSKDDALSALLEQVYNVHRIMSGGKDPAATQPTGDLRARLGDLSGDVKQINDSGNEEARARLALALEDLAWYEIYFDENPNAATPAIDALRGLLGDNAPAVARLQGWAFLKSGKADEAKVKLSAVADDDPLAAMGLVLLSAKQAGNDASAGDAVKSEARRLLTNHPSGLIGAMLLDGLRDLGAAVVPTQHTDAIRQEVEAFPKTWLNVLDKPQQFYALRADPVPSGKVSIAYDEPIFAQVTLQNVAQENFDLTIGPDGVIRPDLWFDVKFTGPGSQNLPGAAFDRIGKAMVLHRGQSVSQIVRLDQPKVSDLLSSNPIMAIQMYFNVFTNPMTAAGGIGPGPGGQRKQLSRVVERSAMPIQQLPNAVADMAKATPDAKIHTLQLLGTYIQIFTGAQANDQSKASAREMLEAIDHTARDQENPPAVRLWARYVLGALKPQREQKVAAVQALAGEDWWVTRMLALSAAMGMPDGGKAIADKLLDDPDPLVLKLATAVSYDLAHPTTRPSTQPSSQPAESSPTTQPATAAPALKL